MVFVPEGPEAVGVEAVTVSSLTVIQVREYQLPNSSGSTHFLKKLVRLVCTKGPHIFVTMYFLNMEILFALFSRKSAQHDVTIPYFTHKASGYAVVMIKLCITVVCRLHSGSSDSSNHYVNHVVIDFELW